MIYNFDKIIDRRGTDSVKWNQQDYADLIPLWVADMDFPASKEIIDALTRRVQHGIYGYAKVPDAFYEAVSDWSNRKHGFHLQREWILPVLGVVPALSAIVAALTETGIKY
ncbi:hypothetical protein KUH03_03625 [Sphingobacterium sp. E70]|uniref:hypothetical protein n=1 Tax=Sphingobacterium sp. E70 TaxID=2853439 RepID=UPI00211CB82B|nr:hypothetical protein [Sphingobacterium sp. E70]ULT26066.1 hypothetical protein KUH03_03625 [Sphingobacterium sp. E70]